MEEIFPVASRLQTCAVDLLFLNNYVVRADAKKKIADTRFTLRHEGDSVTEMVS